MSFSTAAVIRTNSYSIMSKGQYYLRKYIQDSIDILMNYQDKNYEKFCRLLIDEQLFYVKNLPFRRIINEYLQMNSFYHGQIRVHSILWRYKADMKLIKGWVTYSFRFPNLCHPNLYKKFNVNDNLFQKSTKPRHHSKDWYIYIGKQLPKYIGEYLSIQTIVQVNDPPITMLFVNKVTERIDIYFYFKSINTKMTMTFEQPIFK
ncbi:unnamed protein product [Rotaria sp. Silwood2]|nr:unnamed protein product [Rotaria sp. Silwood2]CAF2975212.1 unnamed protein product [Rotaria sp. Silwood2]CAF4300288.1 unnamed protein product [Rotaria sp. Silwood2]CAF4302066.1 unnamed protein product [Rotaria sp. Silwood2]CAF4395894.1 unnamed protein product [Rotaria sp. Silwood2]